MNKNLLHNVFPFLSWTGGVNKDTLKADSIAGLTGAIIVLPQGIAFAMIAGLPPIYGLYTAMVVPIVAALFGSSHHLISGPNTPVSLVFFAVLSQFAAPGSSEFIQLAFVLTLISGVIQFVMGLARMGNLVNFVSKAVIVGFTTGAAALIATSQLKHLLGIEMARGSSFYETLEYLVLHIGETKYQFLSVGLVTLITAILLKQVTKRISWFPHLLLAMVVGSLLAYFFNKNGANIALVGELPKGLPSFNFPEITFAKLTILTPSAAAVALLGLIQAIAIAKSIAIKSQQKIDANQEFIGEGLSNIVGSMFMCYASSGSFTRSGINYDAGAKTPMSAIFAAILLAVIVLLIAPLTQYLPIAAMSGIILLVAYNLVDWGVIKRIIEISRKEAIVLAITFVSTLFLELEFAIYLGVIISLIFYIQRTSSPHVVTLAPDKDNEHRAFVNIERKPMPTCPQLRIIRIDGSLFFGATNKIEDFISKLYEEGEQNLLIVGNGIGLIDMAGAELLEREVHKWQNSGRRMYFCSLRKPVRAYLEQGGFCDRIGKENMFETKLLALKAIYSQLDKNICSTCSTRIFNECKDDIKG